eukprot:gene11077-12336_t
MLQPGENILELSAHVYGNYHKYYTFHSASSRIDLLRGRGFFRSTWQAQGQPALFRLLDIGCNEGDLSMDLAALACEELPEDVRCEVVGADIDSSLIALAQSKQAPPSIQSRVSSRFFAVDFLDIISVEKLKEEVAREEGFHVVSIFSTTMWIHINHGDEGLHKFFQHALSFLSPAGSFLVEPQPTKCYRSAAKRCRKLGLAEPRCYRSISADQAETTVKQAVVTIRSFQHVTPLGQESWGRNLTLFSDKELDILPLDV